MFDYCLENKPIQLSLEELPEVPPTPNHKNRYCFYSIPVFFHIVLLLLYVNLVTIQEGHIGLYYRLV